MDEAPPASPPPAPRVSTRRVIPLALVGALAVSNVAVVLHDHSTQLESASARADLDTAQKAADELARSERAKLDAASAALAKAEAELRDARSAGSSDQMRLAAERDELRKRAAALADRVGELEGERDRLKKRADELDQVMKALEAKKVNVRRLAGIESAPRVEAEVVATDERRVPPVLVLRLPSLEGIEENDRLYLARTNDGKPHETGRALVERVDRARGLVSARIEKLDAGEKVVVGDKLTTYPP